VPQTFVTTVTLPFTAAQKAGDLNAIVVGWNDASAQVSSLTDSKGNLYSLAVGPTVLTGATPLSQSTIMPEHCRRLRRRQLLHGQINAAANYPDIRILEYSGLDLLNPLDVVADATGNSATSTSGAVTTKNANDLLLAANTVNSGSVSAGAGFTQRLLSNPDGLQLRRLPEPGLGRSLRHRSLTLLL
jgi:hypothetical protein